MSNSILLHGCGPLGSAKTIAIQIALEATGSLSVELSSQAWNSSWRLPETAADVFTNATARAEMLGRTGVIPSAGSGRAIRYAGGVKLSP